MAEAATGTELEPARLNLPQGLLDGEPVERIVSLARAPWARQLLTLVGLAAAIAVGFASVLWIREPDYRPLASEYQNVDSAVVTGILDDMGADYRIERDGIIVVASDDLYRAQLKLAEAGAVKNATPGFELLDDQPRFGTSQFMESARFRQGLEGELARTIMAINGIRRARVHLAIPRQSALLRAERQASASVTLSLLPGAELTPGQVKAITRLVAGAVPGLSASAVTVVDQNSRLLSAPDEGANSAETEQLEYIRQREQALQRKIHNVLAPIVGVHRFSAEVSVDVDFTWVEETEERFDPEKGVVLSEKMLDEQRVAERPPAGIPGAVSNQPPAISEAPETLQRAVAGQVAAASGAHTRSESLRNYEHNRTISHRRYPVGEIRRQTVSVLVDDRLTPGEDGSPSTSPWSAEQLAHIEALVKSAVGFDESRGDVVAVVNSTFFVPMEEPEPTPEPLVPVDKLLLYGGIGLSLLLGIVAFRLLRSSAERPESTNFEATLALPEPKDFDDTLLEGVLDDVVSLGTESVDAPMANSAINYVRQLEAIRTLIHYDAARVAEVVKNWVADE